MKKTYFAGAAITTLPLTLGGAAEAGGKGLGGGGALPTGFASGGSSSHNGFETFTGAPNTTTTTPPTNYTETAPHGCGEGTAVWK
jgi:hypothetical protein